MNVLLSPRPRRRLATLAAALVGLIGCDGPTGEPQRSVVSMPGEPAGPAPKRAGITDLEPGATIPTAAGQSIYVPIQTRVVGGDGPAHLTVNVAVRNTDESRPILVTLLRHRDADGNTANDYIRAPRRLAPGGDPGPSLGPEATPEGPGPAASLLVEWVADRTVTPPTVEAVMVGPSGVSFCDAAAWSSRTASCPARPASARTGPVIASRVWVELHVIAPTARSLGPSQGGIIPSGVNARFTR